MSQSREASAAMPAMGYSRPSLVSESGLSVTHVAEDGNTQTTFDFSALDGSQELIKALVAGFATATGQAGRWRSSASAAAGASTLRGFVRHLAAGPHPPATISELGPEVWWAWRTDVESRQRWPGAVNQLRVLLVDTPGLPDTTRKALRARTTKPRTRLYSSYSRAEFQRIRAAASRILRTAEGRIAANLHTLTEHRRGNSPTNARTARIEGRRWGAGMLLDHLAATGSLPAGATGTGLSSVCRALLDLEGAATVNEALFLNSVEILSLAFLLTIERGYNPSVINNLAIPGNRADDHAEDPEVHVVHLDKPRRGPAARYSDENLTGAASTLISRAIRSSAQARATVAALGAPTDSLILFRAGNAHQGRGSALFRTRLPQMQHPSKVWHERAAVLGDDGLPLRVTFQRLRLTEQVLNKTPRQNSATVSESLYRQPDPRTREEGAVAILRGQTDAIEHAHATVAMRSVTAQDLERAKLDPTDLAYRLGVPAERLPLLIAGRLDTATGACLDHRSGPFTEPGVACRASFLMCFACPNAVVTPAHLPRLVALRTALERVGSAVTESVWTEDYAAAYARLCTLLAVHATVEQLAEAEQNLSPSDAETIERLLTRGLDA